MNIHELSNHREQRVRDFKRYQLPSPPLLYFDARARLEARYRFEERIKNLSPEQQVLTFSFMDAFILPRKLRERRQQMLQKKEDV